MMKHQNFLLLISFVCAMVLSACKKDDNKPQSQSIMSRLYVSNADTDAAVLNTLIFDPADKDTLKEPYAFNSQLPDANGILFDPFSGTVFQVSRQNKNIRTFSVNTDGSLAAVAKTSFIDQSLTSAREMAFDHSRKILYVASNADSSIYVYNDASNLTGTVTANKKLKLNGQPWGIHFDNDRLFVVIDQARTEVQLFEGASALVVGTIIPPKKIILSGARRLHGITYSAARDALILTDIGEATASGFKTDGAIHIIDSASTKFTATNSPISPSRTISGLSTGLGNPVDVSWDDRTGKDLVYIAEKANKKILIFKFGNTGNIAPVSYSLLTFPEALFLDAR
ncbi:MAG: YncE family protein [Daejeonella sp.]